MFSEWALCVPWNPVLQLSILTCSLSTGMRAAIASDVCHHWEGTGTSFAIKAPSAVSHSYLPKAHCTKAVQWGPSLYDHWPWHCASGKAHGCVPHSREGNLFSHTLYYPHPNKVALSSQIFLYKNNSFWSLQLASMPRSLAQVHLGDKHSTVPRHWY